MTFVSNQDDTLAVFFNGYRRLYHYEFVHIRELIDGDCDGER